MVEVLCCSVWLEWRCILCGFGFLGLIAVLGGGKLCFVIGVSIL